MPVNFRYRRPGYVVLNVTDIERTAAFATEVFGLDVAGEGPSGERLFRCGQEYQSIVLQPASAPGFVRGCWEMESEDDVEKAFAHYSDLGLDPKWVPAEESAWLGIGSGPAFRMREPVLGVCFEFFADMVEMARPRTNLLTSFERFGHYGINTPDVPASVKFAVEQMGFAPSDYVGETRIMAALLRAWPNPNHHSLAYLPTRGGPAMSHLAYMVSSIDDIGRMFNRIERLNVPRAWGIGRHPTSGSIHLYINDPDGIVWEYTLGMEQFPETGARRPRYMSAAPEDADLWGAIPKPSMMSAIPLVLRDE